ncbi:efflux RND transporter periplasmic adaptor subunit [Thiosulfatihalobacter marinus]|jgi:RND family efflux transporter MFP subunit|uniref:efflux RND transporter periplasmic adaptor subunit n=1 Tax=Thiosulfatihalobacter marinus TaxID=2792481 RepID=UPI0018D66EC8|nr:efflux RND transporter periplasmic adaptor subunit [Thiosulfatihalobacter marinus]
MRFLRQSLTGLFLLAATLAILVYAGQLVRESVEDRLAQANTAPPTRERVFTVSVVTAEPGRESPELVAFGQIQSRRNLEIRAASEGTIVELSENFEEGAEVRAGEVLVRVDPTKARYVVERISSDLLDAQAEQRDAIRTLELAKDELVAAQSQLELRQRAHARQLDLQARGVGTSSSVETAELAMAGARQSVLSNRRALAQAEARVDQAETRLERTRIALAEAETDLRDTVITADFTGTLSEVAVVKGGLVSRNERLARLIDADALEVVFRVSTPQYARLLEENGDLYQAQVTVSLDVMGSDLPTKGEITRDAAAVGDGQTGRVLYARLEQARGLKPGDFVTVRVREPALDNVVRLPAMALDAANQVLLVDQENRLESLQVELLRRQGDDVLVRGAGLAGRQVVARRTPLLGEGIAVKPVPRAGSDAVPKPPEMVALSTEERARLVAFVEGNQRMPADVKQRLLTALNRPEVPAQMIERLQNRMGG